VDNIGGASPDYAFALSAREAVPQGEGYSAPQQRDDPNSYASPRQAGDNPGSYATVDCEVEPDPDACLGMWRRRPLAKDAAIQALLAAGAGVGSFCVRQGSTGVVLMLVLPRSKIGHFRIDEAADGSVQINDLAAVKGRTFPGGLPEVVASLRNGLGPKSGSAAGPKVTVCIPHPDEGGSSDA